MLGYSELDVVARYFREQTSNKIKKKKKKERKNVTQFRRIFFLSEI